jgi:hypothetical protein
VAPRAQSASRPGSSKTRRETERVCEHCGEPTSSLFRCADCFHDQRRAESERHRERLAAQTAERRRAKRVAYERARCVEKAALCIGLQRFAAELGRAPTRDEYPDARRAGYHFGSWGEALAAAGLEPAPPRARWDAEAVVAALRADAELRGRPPTLAEWRRADPDRRRPTAGTACRAFGGSWNRAVRAAGFEPRPPHRPPGGRGFGRPKKTRCIRGHSLADGDPNVAVRKNGLRHCRECARAGQKRRRAARGAA